MCFHISLTKKVEEVEDRFNAYFEWEELYQPYFHFNGWERKYLYIIPQGNNTHIQPSYWGIMPNNIDLADREDWLLKINTLNATSEELFKSRLWSQYIRDNRCLIIANGLFESHSKEGVKLKIPHLFKHEDHSLFAFAGIYNQLEPDLFTATIITREANALFKKIHNTPNKKGSYRMPLILDPSDEHDWLDPYLNDDEVKTLLHTFTKKELITYPVSRDLNRRTVDSNRPDILDRVEYEELNDLFS